MINPIKSGEESSRPTEEMVQTATGPIMVAREGDPRKPAIVTYHDLALNYLSNFSVRKGLQLMKYYKARIVC